MKKINLVLMAVLTLGVVACGAGGQDFQEAEETVENQQGATAENQRGTTEFFNGDGGSVVGEDDFVSVTTNDGTSFICDGGECNLF